MLGAKFVAGQEVVLVGLVSRSDLEGKRGVVQFLDASSLPARYAVSLADTGECVRVLQANLQTI